MEPKQNLRPTKKQKELLSFIQQFIDQKGYSPSYREIMKGCGYTSVATVSLHINNLIRRGHLVKRDRSARSLEIVKGSEAAAAATGVAIKQLKTSESKWLVDKVEIFFKEAEAGGAVAEKDLDRLYVLCGALKVLGLDGAATSFVARLSAIKNRGTDNQFIV